MSERRAADGTVGLVVAGMGSVGSSLLAGVEAARRHLAHPFGSLSEAGGAGRSGDARPLRELAPLAPLHSLALGAFELREDDAHRAAVRAGLLPRFLLEELKVPLRALRGMAGARHAPSRLHLAEALADDLRGFAAHHACARGVLVCTVPGPRLTPLRTLRTAEDVWTALDDSADEVTPGLVYAAAAARAGFGFVAAAPDASLQAPGLAQLFSLGGLPFAGCGLLGPEAALREALERVARTEGLSLSGMTSLCTRTARGDATFGASERSQEIALAPSFAGGGLELSFELRGPLALQLAARALDAALLTELAHRAGAAGVQAWMGALFATPLAAPQAAGKREQATTYAERRDQLLAALPPLAAAAAARATAAA
jgi:Myo-inositol-1-phosphate synthase